MSVLDHPKHLMDAWSVCETLRRLGFRPDQMSVGFGPLTGVGERVLSVTLEAEEIEFVTAAAVAPDGLENSEVLRGWEALWQDVMSATDEELAVAMSRTVSGDYARVVRLAAEVVARGITLPFLSPESTSPLVLVVPHASVLSRGGSA